MLPLRHAAWARFLFNVTKRTMSVHEPLCGNELDNNPVIEPWTPFTCSQFRKYLFEQLQNSPVIKSWDDFYELEKNLTLPPKFSTIRVNTSIITIKDAINKFESICGNNGQQFRIFEHPELDDLVSIEPENVLDIENENNCSSRPKEVIVDKKCAAAVLRGANIYSGGVIGAPSHLKKGDNVTIFADMDGKCLKGRTKKFNDPKMFIASGIATLDRNNLFCPPIEKGVAVKVTKLNVPMAPSIPISKNFFPQNLPSVVCVHVLDPQPGERVLDMCAAPGGKTSHISTRMNGQGLLIALDRGQKRVDKLKANLTAYGDTFVKCYKFNSVNACEPGLESQERTEPPFGPNFFDRILVDAPCSALGIRPKLKSELRVQNIDNYPETQKLLLQTAINLLKVGGVVVYSTCSLTIVENESVVSYILKTNANVRLEKQKPHLGVTGFKGDHDLSDNELDLLQRFVPMNINNGPNCDTIGFFIAKFVKV